MQKEAAGGSLDLGRSQDQYLASKNNLRAQLMKLLNLRHKRTGGSGARQPAGSAGHHRSTNGAKSYQLSDQIDRQKQYIVSQMVNIEDRIYKLNQ